MKPDDKVLLDNLGKISYTLDKAYLSRLSADYGVLYFDEKYNAQGVIDYLSNIRALRVDRWVMDREEKPGECFKNVLSTFADGDHTVGLVIKRTPHDTHMYFVVKNEGLSRNEDSKNNIDLMKESLKGNFPGTHTAVLKVEEMEELFSFSEDNSVAVLANTPSEYSEDYITQGLDKLLNGIVPQRDDESYSVVFLAESLPQADVREILSGFEDMATAIHPFLEYQFQMGKNDTQTTGETSSISNTKSTSDSVMKTHSINIGINGSIGGGRSDMSSTANTVGANAGLSFGGSHSPIKASIGGSIARTAAKALTTLLNVSVGLSAGYGYSWGTTKTVSNGTTDTKGTSSSVSIGKSENTTYTYKSYMITNLLEKLEKTMKRLNESQATGLWKFSTYVFSKYGKTSKNVANSLRAITQGKESYIEPSAIQEWSYTGENQASPFSEIKKYVSHFTHPIFVTDDDSMLVTPTTYVGTAELSHVIAFPRKSLQGLPVLECTQFGREPHTLIPAKADLDIGYGYHMHETVESQRIRLSKEELTKHTFITGSTGSGKSNTIYTLLETLQQSNIKFLVVEPAKGEYKTALRADKRNIAVYGTNPNLKDTHMLHINPFRFPDNVHILEHLDRLVEIFNVCWPMYAAMPAILKDSIERAYEAAGWNLNTSQNKYDSRLYPTFGDVLKQIRIVLSESEYSSDNKGDYTGALVTRIRSLTNGINGLIFTSNDIPDEYLFDRNVIVDLSRVGSSETKSLIMGLLVLKLQEYRMQSCQPNEKLRHVTVLEEAHNLLKRTSTEQTTEGANLLGKSVEMLANSIAEMRTYGEGFVIADQSPGLLDMSVIRNTNTKIILRLPDFSDRELVGKAAGLNDNQIIELGKLERGVASITQSDWLEPVLCKIDKYDGRRTAFEAGQPDVPGLEETDTAEKSLLECIMNREIYRVGDRVDIQRLKEVVIKSKLDAGVKCDFLDYIAVEDPDKALESLRKLVYDFFGAEQAVKAAEHCEKIEDWSQKVMETLEPSIQEYSRNQINLVLSLIVHEKAVREIRYQELCQRFVEVYKDKAKGNVI